MLTMRRFETLSKRHPAYENAGEGRAVVVRALPLYCMSCRGLYFLGRLRYDITKRLLETLRSELCQSVITTKY
jgi:hypothetical protein